MSYTSIAIMSTSPSLRARVTACAATLTNIPFGLPAATWAEGNMLAICSQDGWADAWDKAPLYNPDGSRTDTGARDDVISDAMILQAVTAVLDAQNAAAQAAAAAGDSSAGTPA